MRESASGAFSPEGGGALRRDADYAGALLPAWFRAAAYLLSDAGAALPLQQDHHLVAGE